MPKNLRKWFGTIKHPHAARRRKRRRLQIEQMEQRRLLAAEINIGAVRPDAVFPNSLLAHYLDTQPLVGPRDANPEITFHYGFSSTSDNGGGPQGFNDVALAGDLTGVGFDQSLVVRPFAGALQWLGDTDRDTTQEYLFRFGLADMTPLIADMNGDGIDDVVAVDASTVSGLNEWFISYGVPGSNPFPSNDSTLAIHASFTFGLNTDIPLVGDINGDGRADVISVRDDGSLYDWYISHAVAGPTPYPNNTATVLSTSTTINDYGSNSTVPVIGDWDNDGDDNIGVIDETTTPSTWYLDTNGGGAHEISLQYGLAGDQYIVGRWADVLWNGSANSNWSNPANWSGNAVPTAGQDVVIDQPTLSTTITSSGTANAATVTSTESISVTGGNFNISGDIKSPTFSINGGNLTVNGTLTSPVLSLNTGILTWTAAGQVTDPMIDVGAGSLRNIGGGYTKGVRYNVATSLTVDFNADIILGGEIIGPGQLIKNGPGRLQLTNNNSYLGLTTINAGEIYLTNNGLLGSTAAGTVINSGAALRLAVGKTNTDALTMQGVSPMLVADTGGTATQSGTITLNATDAANFTTNGNGNLVVSGSIGGSSGFTKVGSGTLTLSGANTYDGVTTLQSGTLTVSGAGTLGSTVGGTRVTGNGAFDQVILNLASGVVSNEDFTFNGDNPIIRSNGATLAGDVVLAAVGKIGLHPSGAGSLTISGDVSGSISGTSELDIATDVVFSGNNTYSAVNRIIASGSLTAGSNTGISPNSTAEVLQGTLDLNGFDASVGDLEAPSNATGTVNIGTGTLTIGSSNESLAFLGSITGTGNLIKTGTGTQTLSGTSTFTGVTTVIGGELEIDGTLPGSVIVASGASLSGSGTVGAATVQSGGTARPGNSPGILNTGDFNLAAGATLEIEIGGLGANAGIDYDQVNVTGTVTLAGFLDSAIYSDFNAFEDYVIINNDGVDPVIGTFSGMPEGSSIQVNGVPFYITYVGGDGNDVVLQSDYGLKTVLNTNDSGIGSLRQAILDANAAFGTDAIFFNISGSGPHTIQPLSSFPLITDKVVVDGHELPDLIGSPNIELRGDLAGPGVNGLHLALGSSGSTISGLIINRFSQDGIWVDSSSNTVVGNWIGTDISGTNPAGNSANGIALLAGADSNTIYGNVIAGNHWTGININEADDNVIRGNTIGLGADGETALGHPAVGIYVVGARNQIGGSTVADMNVVSASGFSGIEIIGVGSDDNIVQGNRIGTNRTGTDARGNGVDDLWQSIGGVYIGGGARRNIIGTDGDGNGDAGERNLISGNLGDGVRISDSGTDDNIVAGNYIGTDVSGLVAIANVGSGVNIIGVMRATVGGSAPEAGNIISGNLASGVHIAGASATGNSIQGNLIGTNAAGTAAIGNAIGVTITSSASNNTIGGTTSGAENVISGNSGVGVLVTGVGTTGNVVAGNTIGLASNGIATISNLRGIQISGAASNNLVGTNGDGIGDAQERNVISGNNDLGIWITGNGTNSNIVAGNLIGTDRTGTLDRGNAWDGIRVEGSAKNTRIGTDADGVHDAAERNVISGNNQNGIWVRGAGTDGTVIAGNYLGTNAAGSAVIGNSLRGVHIGEGVKNTRIGTNSDGIADAAEGNLISGNLTGIWLADAGTTGNLVAGNLIGTDVTGLFDLGNAADGVLISLGATTNTIGGSDLTARNIISGNNSRGVAITGSMTSGNIVQGNYIGVNAAGTASLGNGSDGIRVASAGNMIGGSEAGAGNLVSGNGWNGINIDTAAAVGNKIQGNYVGLNAAGTDRIANANHGVLIWGGAIGTIVGTDGDGLNDATEGNVISGNTWDEVSFWTGGADQTVIAGNLLGTTADGLTALTRNRYGVWVTQGALNTRIGTNSDGVSDELERNIIAGGGSDGIRIDVTGNANTLVAGNYIGTDITGTQDLGNAGSGIWIQNSSNNTVGGSALVARNVISGNNGNGVAIRGSGATENTVAGNYIGTNPSGSASIANTNIGVVIEGGAHTNTIGGTSAGEGNVISGNSSHGIDINGVGTNSNVVVGNFVGTDVTGTIAIPNGPQGIAVRNGAASNRIGTDGNGVNDAGERNVISGNQTNGIWLTGSGTSGNVIAGNYIGTDVTGLIDLGNGHSGIWMSAGASGNIIGTDGSNDAFNANERNIISGNDHSGIYLVNSGTNSNVIAGNYIGVDASGGNFLGNNHSGVVFIGGASNNRVGTDGDGMADIDERNIISANTEYGVRIDGAGTTGNAVAGNYLGTDVPGTFALANDVGVGLLGGTSQNLIGTNGDGIFDEAERNIISGNTSDGVRMTGVGTSNNVVAGNYIGTDASGTFAVENGSDGIQIHDGASNNRVGTDGSNDAFNGNERNIISGSGDWGVYILGAGTTENVVAGNYLGTDVSGTTAIRNRAGVVIAFNATNNLVGTDADGIADAEERNILSGNIYGGWIFGSANQNVFAGNYVGTDVTGTQALPNSYGLVIQTSAHSNLIGTDGDGVNDDVERNVVSGNAVTGVNFINNGTVDNVLAGNYIGTDVTGQAALPNGQNGVIIRNGASGNLIGTDGDGNFDLAERNVISGNSLYGVVVKDANTTGNTVSGNYIGTNFSGTSALANNDGGVGLFEGTSGNLIGTDGDGLGDAAERNVISGNNVRGVRLSGAGTSNNRLAGNYIGVDQTGDVALGNTGIGVVFDSGASDNIVGTNSTGDAFDFNEGNVISGNTSWTGVAVYNNGTDRNVFAGNIIGLNASGDTSIRNNGHGIAINAGAGFTRIGTDGNNIADEAERNIISGNRYSNLMVQDSTTIGTIIAGNYVGTDVTGSFGFSSGGGVEIRYGAQSTRVGTDGSNDAFNEHERNVISGANGVGVVVKTPNWNGNLPAGGVQTDNTIVAGNYIGVAADGVTALGNTWSGVQVDRARGTRVGTDGNGTADDLERNIIAGNAHVGVDVSGADQTTVAGNFVGVDKTGDSLLANAWDGIQVRNSATATTVGGDLSVEGNVVAGNGASGIWVAAAGAGTTISNNIVGLNKDGDAAFPHTYWGIGVDQTAGAVVSGNVVSGNSDGGILVRGASAVGNSIENNIVGLSADETLGLGNALSGVYVEDAVNTSITENIIGQNGLHGVELVRGFSTVVAGNLIGLNTASNPFGNQQSGIYVNGAVDTVIGTNGDGVGDDLEGNVVSGNNSHGIELNGVGTANNRIAGNLVGTDLAGKFAIANSQRGIVIEGGASNNTIGGTTAAHRNIISGNTMEGVSISGAGTTGNQVQGNYIGTNVAGDVGIGNGQIGVLVRGATTSNNIIGGTATGAGNLISGNGRQGVELSDGTSFNTVSGNIIGLDASGTSKLANGEDGVLLWLQAQNNTIGGTTPGARNIISGNDAAGVIFRNVGTSNNRVIGNYLGTDISGLNAVANFEAGVTFTTGANNNAIGGVTPGERNVISGNSANGIRIQNGSSANTVSGNFIGTDVTGDLPLGNQRDGVFIASGASGNTIGGSVPGAGNVISGNVLAGVAFQGSGTTGNLAAGNFIGTDVTGTLPLGNQGYGIVVEDNSSDNQIGLNVLNGGNLISANVAGGIQHNSTLSNEILNNRIGTDISGVADLGNSGPGISVINGWAVVGGLAANRSNRIAFNTAGIVVTGNGRASIRGNAIFDNDGLGIDLGNDGVTANDSGDGDTGPSGLQNYPILTPAVAGGQTRVIGQFESTPASSFDIDFFASTVADSSGFGEGQRFLGSISVTTNVSGFVAFDTLVPGTTVNGEFISAIATDSDGNSSEFSNAVMATSTLPPTISVNDIILTEVLGDDGFGQPTTVFAEGQRVRLDGLFDNAETNAGHDVTINWGDGSPVTSIFIPSAAPGFPDPRGFAAEHVYADNLPVFLGSDIYPITIVVADRDDNASGAVTKFVTIQNVAPQFAGSLVATPSSGFEGDETVLSGSFVDAGDDIHSLDINWGDGSAIQTVVLARGSRTFSIPHLFLDDASQLTVTLRDDDGGVVAQSLNVSFANVAPVVSIAGPLGGLEGSPLVVQAIGSDAGALDTIDYSWRVYFNGTQILAASGNPLNFVPADDGSYEIRLLGRDDDGAAASAIVTVPIGNAVPVIQSTSLELRDATGSVVSAVNEGERFTLRGIVSDPGINDSHQVTIAWGDGSPNSVISLAAGSNEFFATHTYADDADTAFPVSIHVTDFDGGQSTLATSINVLNVAPQVSILDNGSDESTVRLRARVVDPSLTDTHSFVWSFPSGTVPVGTPLDQATIAFPRPVSGIASVQVIATDSDSAFDTASAVIAVGTDQDDTITVQPGSVANSVLVSITTLSVPVWQEVPSADVVLIQGLAGNDTITIQPTVLIDAIIDAGAGNDTVYSASGNDTLIGGPGNDYLHAGEGNNVIDISEGDDTAIAGSGDDRYLIFGFSTKTIIDEGGNDTLDFSGVSEPSEDTIDGVNVNLTLDSGEVQTVRTGGDVSLDGQFENVIGTPYKDYLTGNDSSNLLFGGGGDDTIDGGAGDDSLLGGDGNDLIFGGLGDDTIDAGSGDDSIVGGDGNDLIFGGFGDDTIVAGDGDNSIIGGDGNDLIFGGLGDDTIDGGSGDDSIVGGDGNDLIFGGLGDDSIVAGDGDNSIIGGDGNDLIFGGLGDDTIDGGAGDDSIMGGDGNDLIFGGLGDDTIDGGAGNDSISAGDGNDLIFGGVGEDTIDGGLGDDSIGGGDGNDLIFGGLGDDTIDAGGGNDSILGGDGNDVIFGGLTDGNDTIDGGSGDDSIVGGDGNDLIFGGDGDDTIRAGSGDESILGGNGNDVIFGGVSGSDTIDGGAGDDSIIGGGGNDFIFGGDGDDTIIGGTGDASISGGDGNDVIFGGASGSDTIDGGAGDDLIIGGEGNDFIFGGDGDDTIRAGSGNESIVGGEGNDVIFGGASGSDTIDGGAGDDSIIGGGGNDFIFGGDGDDTIIGSTGDASISGGEGNDVIFGGASGSDTIDGGAGDDSIIGGGGNDFIFGGDGDDTIIGGSGNESIVGGDGNDIIFGGDGSDTIDGGAGDDSIIGGEGNDFIFGGDGDDTIIGGSGDESIVGGDGNDIIFGGDGDDTIEGSAGDDSIIGGEGNDFIFGGDGEDTIGSSSGDDSLSGGAGNDLIFTQITGDATITDTTITSGARTVTILDGEALQIIGDEGGNRLDASATTLPVNLVGGAGDDTLIGGSGNTVIDSGEGVDVITGGSGKDVYRFFPGDTGVKQIVDTGGEDTLDFRAMNEGVTVNLSIVGTVQQVTSGLSLILSGDIENAFGSDYDDVLIGNALNNKLYGYGGADYLDGGDGDDILQAGRRRYVFLDFDSATESNEYQYSQAERDAIQARIEEDYAAFDVEFSQTVPQEEEFVSIIFNAAVFVSGSNFVLGGVSNRVGWRELAIDDFVQVDVNGFFGTTANKLSPTSENYVALSSTIASHELAHTYGLRHLDAFGPPGSGVYVGVSNNANRFRPIFTGPAAANETGFHLIASPASVGTSLVDALGNPYFGQREALKLAFSESGSTVAESSSKTSVTLGTQNRMVHQLGDLPGLEVPNTVVQGAAAGQTLSAAAINVVGHIDLDGATSENDFYSFSGSTGDVVTIEVISQSLRHRVNNIIDSVVRVYDATGEIVAYYTSATGAFNDDQMEPTDSVLLDLVLPHNGTFYVEVDTFSFSMPEIPSYLGQFNVVAFCTANPTHIACADTDTGHYELLIYRFDGTVAQPPAADTLIGGAGADTLYGNSGKEVILGFNPDEGDVLFDPSGAASFAQSPPVINSVVDFTIDEGDAFALTMTATDPDGTTDHTWSLESIVGSTFPVGAQINATTGLLQFTPPDNGVFAARVRVTDATNLSTSRVVTFTVNNAAPTAVISNNGPVLEGSPVSVTLGSGSDASSVDAASLRYFFSTMQSERDTSTYVGASATNNASFTFNDNGSYVVYGRVLDKDGGFTDYQTTVTVINANQPPTVTIQTSIDGVFGEASLFTFTATDADAIDQSGLFEYYVEWGDGTTSTVTGPSVMTISHTYAGVSPTGTFTITANAKDARGAVGPDATANFAVLGWTVMADPIHAGDAILVVVGSQGDDNIRIREKKGDFLRVRIKDRDDQVKYKGTVVGDVDRILVFGLGGNDKITIDDDIDIDAQIWGGDGDDSIKGGSGNDVIFGGAGDDILYGGDGRDILVGGTGQDRIHGDKHDDILIGGYTTFDEEFNQLAPISLFPASARLSLNDQRLAIEAIMAEWTSSRTYSQRRTNISGTGTGPRNNGTKFLKFNAPLVTDNTVFDDGVEDKIWGDGGLDWFLANTDGPIGIRDDVKDLSGSEVVNDTDQWW